MDLHGHMHEFAVNLQERAEIFRGHRGVGGHAEDAGVGRNGASSGGRVGSGAGGINNGPSHVPADVGNGSDDDIVARQLREAAMKERDPQLQEKLWQEYRDYKKGT